MKKVQNQGDSEEDSEERIERAGMLQAALDQELMAQVSLLCMYAPACMGSYVLIMSRVVSG